MRKATLLALAIGILITLHLDAQQPDSVLTKLRKAGIPEAAGSVPVLYPESQKERALALQKALEAAHDWYQKQLNIHLPIALVLLDSKMQEIISDRNPAPHNSQPPGEPGLILMPPPGQGQPPAGADRDHRPGGILQNEHVLFHEDGHLLARLLTISAGNAFVGELIANIFGLAYIQARRPDLNWFLEDRRSGERPAPRYTSLADFDYLYSGVGLPNMYWFQWQLERLADFLVGDQSLPDVVEKLQKAFPSNQRKQQTIEEIDSRLEAIRPGFLKLAGSLGGPSTIPQIAPSACHDSPKGTGSSYVVIRNDTADSIEIADPDGRSSTIPAHSWQRYSITVGSAIRLPDGTCLTARENPSLAVIAKYR